MELSKEEITEIFCKELEIERGGFNPWSNMNEAWLIACHFRLCVVPYMNVWTAFKEGRWEMDSVKHLAKEASEAICLAGIYYLNHPQLPDYDTAMTSRVVESN